MQTFTRGHARFAPVGPALLAALALIGLLLAFQAVLEQAVRQGEQRRAAAAVQLDGAWRCRVLRGRDAVDDCLQRLVTASADLTQGQGTTSGSVAGGVIHREPDAPVPPR